MNSRGKSFVTMGISTVLQMLINIFKTKIVAMVIGPSGLSVVAYLNNFIATITSYTNLGLNNGIVTTISKKNDQNDQNEIKNIEVTAYYSTLIISIVSTFILFVFSKSISNLLFSDDKYRLYIIIIAIAIPFITINKITISVINGFKSVKKLAIANVITSIIVFLISVLLVYIYGLDGAIITIPIVAVITFAIYFYYSIKIFKVREIPVIWKMKFFKLESISVLFRYGVVVIITSLMTNIAMLILRKIIINKLGLDYNGYLQALIGISNQYLSLILSTLMIYYLPTLSSKTKNKEIVEEVNLTLNMVIKIVFPIIIGILMLKEVAIIILYSKEFLFITKFLPIFLISDFIKVIAWTLSGPMYSLPKLKMQILSEIINDTVLIIVPLLLIDKYSLYSVGISYIVIQLLLTGMYLICFKRSIELKIDKANIYLISNSFIILIIAVVCSYLDISFITNTIINILLIIIFFILNINKKDIEKIIKSIKRR